MSCTYSTAKDQMGVLFKTAWDAGSAAIVGYVPEIRWQGVEPDNEPDQSKFFSRVSFKMVLEGKAGPGSPGPGASQVYESNGLMFVQLFGPMSEGDEVWDNLCSLADLALNSIRGKKTANGVWFRNERRNELTPDKKFQRINVVAEFQFNEIR